jgi:KaiC/GvpD/RAD55 family RecA-like ATPase
MSLPPRDRLTLRRAFKQFSYDVRARGISADEIDEFLLERIGDHVDTPQDDDGAALLTRRIDLQSLLSAPPKPIDWLVSGILGSGEVVNLAAKWGVGKSWFALDLALTVADEARQTFLGRKASHGRVIYLDEEGTEDLVRERLALLGCQSHVAANLHYLLHSGLKLTDSEALQQLYEAVAKTQPALVVFDSLTRFYTGLEENSANDMAKLTALISPLSRHYGASVLLVDHRTKGGSGDPSDAARGSGEKAAGVDRIWSLEGKDGDLKIRHGKTRRGKPPPVIAFRRRSSLEADAYSSEGGKWEIGSVGVWHEPGLSSEVEAATLHAALTEALRSNGGQMLMTDVQQHVYAGNRDRMNRGLKDATERGIVRRELSTDDRRTRFVVLVEKASGASDGQAA